MGGELAKKIILALDEYGRNVDSVEYGLPIDPDTKSFESTRAEEMLNLVEPLIEAEKKKLLMKFCESHPLHRGVQITESQIEEFLKKV
jgi:hypothetical protein